MQDRRNKGLCMFCEEQYTLGHHLKHRRSQIYVIDGDDDLDKDELEQLEALIEEAHEAEEGDKAPLISLNALDFSTSYNCMRVVGQTWKRKLHILIDPGSSHNFIDINTTKELGCKLVNIPPQVVSVAGGYKMVAEFKCDNFKWHLQGYELSVDVMTLPIGCCDMVLGI